MQQRTDESEGRMQGGKEAGCTADKRSGFVATDKNWRTRGSWWAAEHWKSKKDGDGRNSAGGEGQTCPAGRKENEGGSGRRSHE